MSKVSTKTSDWKVKSVGDLSGFAGLGGGVKHLAIWSDSLKTGTHGIVVFVGVGGEAKFKIPKLDVLFGDSYEFMKSYIENMSKMTEGTIKAGSGYDPLTVFSAFSLSEFSGSAIAQAGAGISAIAGPKVEGLTGYSHDRPIYSIPPAIGVGWGLGAGGSASFGMVLTPFLGSYSKEKQRIDNMRKEMELNRRASDPLVRPMGGFQ